jgi:hypothetical protein
MTKRELKQIVKKALIRENGYAPSCREITLLEANGDGQYILFSIGSFEYSWDGITMDKRPAKVSE